MLQNPQLRREPAFPRGPRAEMSEKTWNRVRLQSSFILKPWLDDKQRAQYCEVAEWEVMAWRGL